MLALTEWTDFTNVLAECDFALTNGKLIFAVTSADNDAGLPRFAVYTCDTDGLPDGGSVYEGNIFAIAMMALKRHA